MTLYEHWTDEDKEAYAKAARKGKRQGGLAFAVICHSYGRRPSNFKDLRKRLDRELGITYGAPESYVNVDAFDESTPEPEVKEEDPEEVFARLEREYHEKVREEQQRLAHTQAERQLRVIMGERSRPAGVRRQREIAVLSVSDLHWAKKTSSFNIDILKTRMEILLNKIAGIRDRLASNLDIEKLILLGLGDLIDGAGIYPTQPHHQQETNADEQVWACGDFLAKWTLSLVDIFGEVEWEGVPGNHGRDGKHNHERQNADLRLYRDLTGNLKGIVPVGWNRTGSPFMRKVPIYGHSVLLAHGHQFKAHMSIPWYGLQTRLARWSTGKFAPFDLFVCGHHHTYGMHQINRILALMSGTAVTDDDWAREELGYDSATRWHLFGVSPTRIQTWHYGVELAGYGVDEMAA